MNVDREHLGELVLRRRRAGEALGPDAPAIEAHANACPECRGRIRALDEEQRRFENEISFDRFAAGVERAAREPTVSRRRMPRTRAWVGSALAMAAAVALVVTFRPGPGRESTNRTKGGAGIVVRIAGANGQRNARVDGSEALARGERVRIGYAAGPHRYLLSLSIDDRGNVDALYPERGQSLPVADGEGSATRYLPDSFELTGPGIERIIVVLSDEPIDFDAARRAARVAYDKAGGDLRGLLRLGLPGEEFSRTFSKP